MSTTIQSFLDYLLLEKKYSVHTVTAYKNDLITFFDFIQSNYSQDDLLQVNYAQIRSWIVFLVNKELTNRSINRKVSSLRAFYKFQQKLSLIAENPLTKHKALKVAKRIQVPFNTNEIESVLEQFVIENDLESIRNKAIVELFYSTGIRRNELINLKVNDVDFSNKTIKVLGKRNKERYIPLLKTVQGTLKQYLKFKNDQYPLVEELFFTSRGKKMYPTLVYRLINNYFSKVSTKVKKSPHVLRHSFATHLLDEGADMNSVKELLGHSSLASTQVYTHGSMSKLKQVYNQAHPRSSKN